MVTYDDLNEIIIVYYSFIFFYDKKILVNNAV